MASGFTKKLTFSAVLVLTMVSLGSVASAATSVVPTYSLTKYGAKCNGSTNDQPALKAAIADVRKRGGGVISIPSATCKIVQTGAAPSTDLSGPVTLRGATAASTLSFQTDTAGQFRSLFAVHGANVSVEQLNIIRGNDVYGVMFDVNPSSNFTLNKVVLDGRKPLYKSDIHGLRTNGGSGQTIANMRILNSTVKNLDFGLFQDSSMTETLNGVTVDHSTFANNYDDDLEFNSPSGKMINVSVTHSLFSNNKAANDKAPSGFGVGLANVQHVSISSNTFSGYRYDPVHIEDRSANVVVANNKFAKSFTANLNYASHVFIISGAHDITVTGNSFDTRANMNQVDAVYAGPGGSPKAPYNIAIKGNSYVLRPNAKTLGNYGALGVTQSGNKVTRVS